MCGLMETMGMFSSLYLVVAFLFLFFFFFIFFFLFVAFFVNGMHDVHEVRHRIPYKYQLNECKLVKRHRQHGMGTLFTLSVCTMYYVMRHKRNVSNANELIQSTRVYC